MTTHRIRGCLLAVTALVAVSWGCSHIKSAVQEARSGEMGREGWWKGSVTPARVEAVRHGERVMIFTGETPDTFRIKVCPNTLTIPVPPSVLKVIAVSHSEINAEVRTYGVPEGWTWDRVREWYLKWFDFKPTTGDQAGAKP
jgi:hypothetical protein